MKTCHNCGCNVINDEILMEMFSEITGMKVEAIKHQMRTHWTEGVEYRKDGGRIWLHVENIKRRKNWQESPSMESGSGSNSGRGQTAHSGASQSKRKTPRIVVNG